MKQCPNCKVKMQNVNNKEWKPHLRGTWEITSSCWLCPNCGCYEVSGQYSQEQLKELKESGVFEGD